MWTPQFDGTNRHSGRRFNNLGPKGGPRKRFDVGPDPAVAFRFKLEISGVTIAHFQEISGLTYETEVFPYREGGLNTHEHKLMGQAKFTNLVIKNGMTNSRDLWSWRMDALNNRAAARKDGSVVLVGSDGADIQRWSFTRGWPCKWEGPQLNSNQNAAAFEKIEIAYDRLTVG